MVPTVESVCVCVLASFSQSHSCALCHPLHNQPMASSMRMQSLLPSWDSWLPCLATYMSLSSLCPVDVRCNTQASSPWAAPHTRFIHTAHTNGTDHSKVPRLKAALFMQSLHHASSKAVRKPHCAPTRRHALTTQDHTHTTASGGDAALAAARGIRGQSVGGVWRCIKGAQTPWQRRWWRQRCVCSLLHLDRQLWHRHSHLWQCHTSCGSHVGAAASGCVPRCCSCCSHTPLCIVVPTGLHSRHRVPSL